MGQVTISSSSFCRICRNLILLPKQVVEITAHEATDMHQPPLASAGHALGERWTAQPPQGEGKCVDTRRRTGCA